MNKRTYQSQHLKFLMLAIAMMVLLDRFVFDGTRPYIDEVRQEAAQEAIQEFKEQQQREMELASFEPAIEMSEDVPEIEEIEPPLWKKNAVPVAMDPDKAKVIIVIDDLGMSRGYSKDIMELPAPLTLAFLPYAQRVGELVEQGRENGHEIMVHMPMEPENSELDLGDIFLSTAQTPSEFSRMLDKGLGVFDGYVGINNHMGSKLTANKEAMRRVMQELYKREVLFLDSRTIGSSVAAKMAASYSVPYAVRDVFLDHDESLDSVRAALMKVESVAKDHGQAIAIGHPKPNTIKALKEWLPTLNEKGFQLVPVSAVVTIPLSASSSAVASGPEFGSAQAPVQPHQ